MDRTKVYCLDKGIQSCKFPVYYDPMHIGGGPLFIDKIFSKPRFLQRHKECKSVLEVCSGPGFIGWYLYNKLKMSSINFLDIHAPVEKDLIKTGKFNNIDFHFLWRCKNLGLLNILSINKGPPPMCIG